MTIDLSNPIVIGVSIAVISAIILGTFHYVRTLVLLKVTDKKLSDVLSEVNALHQNYKAEIADIKKKHIHELTQAVERALDTYDKRMDKFLEHNKPLRGFQKLVKYGDLTNLK